MLMKTPKVISTLWAVASIVFLLQQSGTNAQNSSSMKLARTTDEIVESFPSSKVLNMVMPKTVDLSNDITTALTVRVEPSFEEEFQYVFLKRRDGGIELIKKRSASGNIHFAITNIEQQASVLTPVEMAKLIHMLETRTRISAAKFNDLINELDTAVLEHERREAVRREDNERRRKAGEYVASNSRDGTRYVIWMDGETKYDVVAHGVSYKSAPQKDESPLIAWVRHLVRQL